MLRPPLAAALAAVALLAGCTAAPAPSDAEEPAAAPPPVEEVPIGAESPPPPPQEWSLHVFPMQGKLTIAASAADIYYTNPTAALDAHDFVFPLYPGAAWMTLDLTWADAHHDFDLEVAPPGCDLSTGAPPCMFLDGGSAGAGDSPVHLNITDPALLNLTGDWHAVVWAKLAVNGYYAGAVAISYPPPGLATAGAARPG